MNAGPRRVLFLLDIFGGVHGGTEGQVAALVSRLPREVSAELWVLQDSPWLATHPFPCPWRALRLPGRRDPRWAYRLWTAARAIRRGGFDLIHAFHSDTCVWAPWLGRMAGVPVVTSRRDLGYWQTPMRLLALRRANRHATIVVANAEAVARRTVDEEHAHPAHVRVVTNGHDPARFVRTHDGRVRADLGIPRDAFVAGLVANARPLKRQRDLLDALAALPAAGPEAHALLVGTGSSAELAALHAHAASLQIAGRVHVHGVTGDVLPWLEAMDVGVLASESEGLSNAILEYMAVGLPVVATPVGGNPELVEEGVTGALFPVGDTAALMAALERFRRDPAERVRCGEAGRRRFLERFTVERMVEATRRVQQEAYRRFHAPRVPAAWRVRFVRERTEIEALAAQWESWLDGRGFFLSPTWVATWCDAWGTKPAIVVVEDAGGGVRGLLPLVEERGGVYGFAGQDLGADHLDVVAAPGCGEAVAAAALAALARRGFHRLALRHVRADGALRAALHHPRQGLSWDERRATICHEIRVAGSFDDYLGQQFSRKRRHELRRSTKRLLEQEDVAVERPQQLQEARGMLRRLFQLHAKRFLGRDAETAFHGARIAAFHDLLLERLWVRGEAVLLALTQGERDLAVYYAFRFKDRLLHFQSGIDDSTGASPGSALRFVLVEQEAFIPGLAAFDFLDGDETYKHAWATGAHVLFDIHLEPRGFRGRLAAWARSARPLVRLALNRP